MKKALTAMTRFVLVGALTFACQDDGMLIAEQIPAEPMASPAPASGATDLEKAAVQSLLLDNCGSCHGMTASRPAHSLPSAAARLGVRVIADIGDIDGLVAAGLIEPGVPEESALVSLIISGQMPPTTSGLPPVSAQDLQRLKRFVLRLDPPTPSEVVGILLRNCGSCHAGSSSVVLPINEIGDLGVLVAAGLIVPGDRDRSQVYTRADAGDMPPRDSGLPPLSLHDLARLGGFIDLLP